MMREAAEALKLTAKDLKKLGVVDTIIDEPIGGAQRDPIKTYEKVKSVLYKNIVELEKLGGSELKKKRQEKFLGIGNLKL